MVGAKNVLLFLIKLEPPVLSNRDKSHLQKAPGPNAINFQSCFMNGFERNHHKQWNNKQGKEKDHRKDGPERIQTS